MLHSVLWLQSLTIRLSICLPDSLNDVHPQHLDDIEPFCHELIVQLLGGAALLLDLSWKLGSYVLLPGRDHGGIALESGLRCPEEESVQRGQRLGSGSRRHIGIVNAMGWLDWEEYVSLSKVNLESGRPREFRSISASGGYD